MIRRICVFLLCVLCTLPLAAQELPPMATDRPDFTEGTSTMPPGQIQIETGATWEESGEEDILTVGELLVRIGVGEMWEARLGVGSWARLDLPGAERIDGYEDPELSVKIRLTPTADDRPPGYPAVALLLATTAPVGSEDLTADTWQPTALFAFDWVVTDRLSIGSNVGYSYAGDEDDQFHQGFASVVAGFAATDRLGVFLEGYGFTEEEPEGDPTQYVDTGVTFAVTGNLQLDARIGFGLNDPSPERLVGVGASIRF